LAVRDRASRTARRGRGGILPADWPNVYSAAEVPRRIFEKHGFAVAGINARNVKPLNEILISTEPLRQPVGFTLEDHVLACGFGSAVAEFALAQPLGQLDASKLCLLSIPDQFIDHGDRTQQLAEAALDVDTLTSRVAERLAAVRTIAARMASG